MDTEMKKQTMASKPQQIYYNNKTGIYKRCFSYR